MIQFAPSQSGVGLASMLHRVRARVNITVLKGQIVEADLRNAFTSLLTEGQDGSGLATFTFPEPDSARKAVVHAVADADTAANKLGWFTLFGRVQVRFETAAVKGQGYGVGSGGQGARIKFIALESGTGLIWCLFCGSVGFGNGDVGTMSGNDPPVADLTVTPSSGTAPLAVTLDASASTDDSAITKYEFNLDDGAGWRDNLTDATYDAVLAAGTYSLAVRVTDDGTPALQDIATVNIVVSSPGGGTSNTRTPEDSGGSDGTGTGEVPGEVDGTN